ncbi:type 3 dihydrofolate reductase [Sphingobacterium sp.]|uniref:type 3 dihydrofolate reductase n=1 Tax=Sphingobacterium sp. TaxID=341027 RepID=UPI0028A2AD5C|nr:type 3 dihydrofolate reductase [Sphingobacterium sp.]
MSNPTITLIVAAAENNAIGIDNQMPWHLPNDFKYFKRNTLEHSVLMGRKTFEAIGRPLPDRRNIVITRNANFQAEDIDVANSIQEALLYCRDEREVYIIGGANIYQQALPLASKVLLTRVHTNIKGDAFFPVLSSEEWELVSSDPHQADDRHAFDYSFEVYKRK